MSSSLARNSLANGVAGMATTLAGVISTVIVARLLGVEGTGVIAFAVWIVTFSLLAGDLGVVGALPRYIAATAPTAATPGRDPDAVTAFLFRPFVLLNALIFAGLIGYGFWVGLAHPESAFTIDTDSYKTSALFFCIVAGAFLAQAFANFTNAYLRGHARFGRLTIIALISAGVQIVTTLIGAFLFGIAGGLVGAILGYIIPAAMAPFLTAPGARLADDLRRRIGRYALEAWFGYIVTAFAWSRMEFVFIEHYFGSEAVGLYTAGLTLTNIATQGPMLLTGALLPFLAGRAAMGDAAQVKSSFRYFLRLFTLGVAPACFGMAAISGELIPLIFGADFAPASKVATVLLVASAVTIPASLSTIYLLALERTRFVLAAASVGALLVVAAGITIVPEFGGIGAAVSRSLIQLIVVGAGLWYARVYLQTPLGAGTLGLILIAAAVCGLAAFGVTSAIGGITGVALAILAGIVVYGVALRLAGVFSHEDVELIAGGAGFLPGPLHSALVTLARLLVRKPA